MSSINKAILIGNLGRDPETRNLPDGSSVVNFSIATTDRYKDKTGAMRESTEWHNITMFGRVAENAANLLKKGTKVYIEGKIKTDKWTNQQGQSQNTTKIIASEFQVLSGRQAASEDEQDSAAPAAPAIKQPARPSPMPIHRAAPVSPSDNLDFDDDIPF